MAGGNKDKKHAPRTFLGFGVPLRHEGFRPGDSMDPQWDKCYKSIKPKIENGGIVIISGNRGTGKTQMGICLCGFVTHKLEKSAYYTKAFDIFLDIRDGMGLNSEKQALKSFINPYLLVIDAFEVTSGTEFENRCIDHIIDRRYDDMKSTVIITNKKIDKFAVDFGSSNIDRIKECGGLVELTGESKRRSSGEEG